MNEKLLSSMSFKIYIARSLKFLKILSHQLTIYQHLSLINQTSQFFIALAKLKIKSRKCKTFFRTYFFHFRQKSHLTH